MQSSTTNFIFNVSIGGSEQQTNVITAQALFKTFDISVATVIFGVVSNKAKVKEECYDL